MDPVRSSSSNIDKQKKERRSRLSANFLEKITKQDKTSNGVDCVFCKIIQHEIPADILQESDNAVIFKDIRPSAPIHYLVVPKKHVSSIKEVSHSDESVLGHIVLMAKEAAEKLNLSGYRLIFNVGRDGGQVIDHIHLHLLGGWIKE